MELYFFRHGIAVERSGKIADAERPLTAKGEARTRLVAKRLGQLGLYFEGILTSPLVRARQTAMILAEAQLGPQPQVFQGLAPGGSLGAFLAWLEQWDAAPDAKLIIVGHQPELGEWAEAIAFGQTGQHLALKKAGLIGIRSGAARIQAHTDNQLFLLTAPKWLLP
ncbi:phosphohistidine phosphatase SixA [Synechococcus moorigangaii CMS01]|nr:phosphohistidine phosphatase SixA [Synechococcus moorigangaii CMS01]